ncbi:MAG: orange carotenoid-binding protein [Oculatellaceae cyanobacterium Prado106]|jgi:hypothetical protein|nr:orange carotenoid-binding protein [Oculatellaceae cyanobacterium Prado106]
MAFTIDSARGIFPNTLSADVVPATIARFNQLSVDDQLALIWFAYLEIGKTIAIASPGAAGMAVAESTLDQIRQMPFREQSQIMRDLAQRVDTPINRAYASWSMNIKLGFWYRLGEWMEEGSITPIPQGYKLSANAAAVLLAIQNLDSGQQITVLRNAVVDMGYDSKNAVRTAQPEVVPQAPSERTPVTIEGVTHPTILSYMDNLNANDFDALVQLFAPDGALQPPFKKPIVGQENLLRFFKEDCQDLRLIPERGVVDPTEDGYTQIKVTGRVQTPWFGANVGMNIAWRFLLDPQDQIFFVAIDLLASSKELLNLAR